MAIDEMSEHDEQDAGLAKRPTSALVFGILQVCFGGIGILATLAQMFSNEPSGPVEQTGNAVGMVISIFMVFNGILLFQASLLSRSLFLVYAAVSCSVTIIFPFLGYGEMKEAIAREMEDAPPGMPSMEFMENVAITAVVVVVILQLIYPIVGACIFLRRRNHEAFLAYNQMRER